MNRRERRRRAAMARHNRFFDEHVRHLAEVGPEVLGTPGVNHMVFIHSAWCAIYDGKSCNCDPQIKFFAEPNRN
jgi:hypothetical protein